MKSTSKKGMALMLTMLVITFVLVLLGAFITINQSQFSLIKSSQNKDALDRASRSLYEYCFQRLENNKNWGAANFTSTHEDSEVARSLTVFELENSTKIKGETVGDAVAFEVTILNNIDGTGVRDGVPFGSCRLQINVERNGRTAQTLAQLNTAPLYDSSAVASEGLYLDAHKLDIKSKDPNRNMVRSKKGIRAPGTESLEFTPAADAAERGVLWSAQDIELGGTNVTTDRDARDLALVETGARFLDRSKTNYDIHELKAGDIKLAKQAVHIDPGIYIFTQPDVAYYDDSGSLRETKVMALERRDYQLVDGKPQIGKVLEVWYKGQLSNNSNITENVIINTTVEEGSVNPYGDIAKAHRVDGSAFAIQGQAVQANFDTRSLFIKANFDIQVEGEFGLDSNHGDYPPRLVFHDYDQDPTVARERGSITAKNDILIKGSVFGTGKLVSKEGSVSMHPTHVDVESDTESDLSIYAKKNVNIVPPKTWIDKGDVRFKGLIYAEGDVDIRVDAQSTYGQNLSIEGAVVARKGKVSMHAKSIELIYNPEYLDSFVQEMPADRIHLERAVWIP